MTTPNKYLWQFIDRWAADKPESEAIVFGDTRMTWRELAGAVDRMARALIELGVEKGDCVAMIAMARPEFIVTFMAAVKIGAIWTGISPRFSIGEMARILRDCRPTVLVTLDRYEHSNLVERALTFSFELSCIREILVIGNAPAGTLEFNELLVRPGTHLTEALTRRINDASEYDDALLMYTSGSSGTPKGVLHSHHGLLCNVQHEHRLFEINRDTRILLHFPINHVAADVEIGVCALYAGACMVMMDGFDAQKTLETIDREKITVVGQVPAMYLLELREAHFQQTRWDSVKTFVWGGSAAPQGMLNALQTICARTGAHMITGYGSTELGGFVTATRLDDAVEGLGEHAGAAYENCEIRIVDEKRCSLPPGAVGEIAVRGPMLMKGYLNSPAFTQEVMDAEGWFYTNDLGRLSPDGLLSICGRRSEMFKTGGENVFPCEIEAVLESHPAVLYAAVVAVPDEVFDEVSHAHVMAVKGAQISDTALLDWCKARLAHYKIPRSIAIHAALPLLPNGKVDKLRLRAMLRI